MFNQSSTFSDVLESGTLFNQSSKFSDVLENGILFNQSSTFSDVLESGILFNQSSTFSDVLESGISSLARLHVMSCRSCVQYFNCCVIKKHKYTMSSFSCVYLTYP